MEISKLSETERRLVMVERMPLTQNQIAERIGVSAAFLSRWLKGLRKSRRVEAEFYRLYQQHAPSQD